MMLPQKETLTIEFKSDVKPYPDKELVEAIAAMANTKGGELYLGIEDDGRATGLSKQHRDEIGVVALIANSTVPSVATRAEIISENGHEVLKISVPMSKAIISTSTGKILRRRLKLDGTPEVVPLYAYEINSRLSELSLLDISAQPLAGATEDDIAPEQLDRLKKIIKTNPGGEKGLLQLADDELELALRLAVREGEILRPTFTGLLLLGKEEALQKFLPTARACFQVLQGTRVKMNAAFSKPLLETLEILENYIRPWNLENEIENGLFRIPIPEFDHGAIREGLVNAFCHRDYSLLGAVRVAIDDEGMSITSPGGFIDGVSIQNLLTVEPHGRNPALADALKRIGLAEKTGRGIDRIFEGSIIYGRPWPDYSETTARYVRLYFRRAKADAAFTKMITDALKDQNRSLSIYALMILSCLREERRLGVEEIMARTHLQEAKLETSLEMLAERGLIEAYGQGRNKEYILGKEYYVNNDEQSAHARRAGIDKSRCREMIRKLAAANGGSFTKKDVRELLKIGTNEAYNLLRELVTDGVIELAQSGRYAKYKLKDYEA